MKVKSFLRRAGSVFLCAATVLTTFNVNSLTAFAEGVGNESTIVNNLGDNVIINNDYVGTGDELDTEDENEQNIAGENTDNEETSENGG